MTANLLERAKELRELAEEIHVEGQKRCAICFWPLAASADEGCVRGNCSMRGGPDEFERNSHRANVEAILKVLKESALLARVQTEAQLSEAQNWHRFNKDHDDDGWCCQREEELRDEVMALDQAAAPPPAPKEQK